MDKYRDFLECVFLSIMSIALVMLVTLMADLIARPERYKAIKTEGVRYDADK